MTKKHVSSTVVFHPDTPLHAIREFVNALGGTIIFDPDDFVWREKKLNPVSVRKLVKRYGDKWRYYTPYYLREPFDRNAATEYFDCVLSRQGNFKEKAASLQRERFSDETEDPRLRIQEESKESKEPEGMYL